jgi:hypothetical protein
LGSQKAFSNLPIYSTVLSNTTIDDITSRFVWKWNGINYEGNQTKKINILLMLYH